MDYEGRNDGAGAEDVERNGSGGEKQLARMFRRHGIRYRYEYPVALIERGKVRVWYPDFWLPAYGVAVDYAGLMDKAEYARGMAYRHLVYVENDVAHVYVSPADMTGYWPKRILEAIAVEAEARFEKVHELRRAILDGKYG